MKVYRAIEFSKLIWMISDDASLRWNEAHIYHENNNPQESNWWMNPALRPFKHEMISDIVHHGQDKFFDKSLEFNAMQGGRFNPSRSFGVLYTSSDPLMASLEVLYHQFISAYPLYKRMNRNSNQFTSSFNMKVPQHLRILTIVFEIEIDDNYCLREVCCDLEDLKEDCKLLGFERYIGDKFSRNFIFGNDYEISRILGCYLHSNDDPTYKVPSARVEFETQDALNIRNYLIPEKRYDPNKIDLTGRYLEFNSVINLEATENIGHDVYLEVIGKTVEPLNFFLQPIPHNNKPRNQYVRYEPNLNDGNDKKRFHRSVEVQRFFS
jgi:hypothetical protein